MCRYSADKIPINQQQSEPAGMLLPLILNPNDREEATSSTVSKSDKPEVQNQAMQEAHSDKDVGVEPNIFF